MSKLLTLSLRLSTATLERKLISAVCNPDLILTVPKLMTTGEDWNIDSLENRDPSITRPRDT